MTINNGTKINTLLQSHPSGVVLLSSYLVKQGYSRALLQQYTISNWLESIGRGALIRPGDEVDYLGAIYALQRQAGLSIHPGSHTALGLQGKTHYLAIGYSKAILFGTEKESCPSWFYGKEWEQEITYHASSFLPPYEGLVEIERKSFTVLVSGMLRAILESLYLAKSEEDLILCYDYVETLNAPVPRKAQSLLEQCNSAKVKRLFLYMAEKAGHEWVKKLDYQKLNLGKGKYSLYKHGTYVSKFKMTVPTRLAEHV